MSVEQAYDSRGEWQHFDFAHIAAPAAWRTVAVLQAAGIVVLEVDRYEAMLRLLLKENALSDDAKVRARLRKSGLTGQVPRFVRIPTVVANALETCEAPDPSTLVTPVRDAAASAYLLGGIVGCAGVIAAALRDGAALR